MEHIHTYVCVLNQVISLAFYFTLTLERFAGTPVYKTKLAILLASIKAIPKGGGFQDALNWLQNPEQMQKDLRQSFEEIERMLDIVRSVPDNPYNDEEQICKAILDKIEENKKK